MKWSRRTIPATEFKARCLVLLDQVQKTGEALVVTKRGKPVAKIVAIEHEIEERRPLRGSVRFIGDIVEPIDEPWEASRPYSRRRRTRRP